MENEHEIFEENLINNVNVMKMPTTVQNDDFFLFVSGPQGISPQGTERNKTKLIIIIIIQ